MTHPIRLPTYLWMGPPKIGKSLAAIRCFGPQALWYSFDSGAMAPAIQSDLNPWRKNCDLASGDDGHTHSAACGKVLIPRNIDCFSVTDPFGEVLVALEVARALAADGLVSFVIFDTLTTFADRLYRQITIDERVRTTFGDANRELGSRVKRIIDLALEIGVGVVFLTHEREPQSINGRSTPGGPLLAGDLVKSVPGLVDSVYRFGYGVSGIKTTRIVYCPENDAEWRVGCRWGALVGQRPADDIREVVQTAIRRAIELHELSQ